MALHGEGRDGLLVTFGNGVYLCRRALALLHENGVRATVWDLRWLAPLPVEALNDVASGYDVVVVVDETRQSGGVSEGVFDAALVYGGFSGRLSRVTSADSFIPLGPAAHTVLLSEDDIVHAVLRPTRKPSQLMSRIRERALNQSPCPCGTSQPASAAPPRSRWTSSICRPRAHRSPRNALGRRTAGTGA